MLSVRLHPDCVDKPAYRHLPLTWQWATMVFGRLEILVPSQAAVIGNPDDFEFRCVGKTRMVRVRREACHRNRHLRPDQAYPVVGEAPEGLWLEAAGIGDLLLNADQCIVAREDLVDIAPPSDHISRNGDQNERSPA